MIEAPAADAWSERSLLRGFAQGTLWALASLAFLDRELIEFWGMKGFHSLVLLFLVAVVWLVLLRGLLRRAEPRGWGAGGVFVLAFFLTAGRVLAEWVATWGSEPALASEAVRDLPNMLGWAVAWGVPSAAYLAGLRKWGHGPQTLAAFGVAALFALLADASVAYLGRGSANAILFAEARDAAFPWGAVLGEGAARVATDLVGLVGGWWLIDRLGARLAEPTAEG